MDAAVERFSEVPLFASLTQMEIADLLSIGRSRNVKEGDVIIREGDQDHGFYVIRMGAFEVRKKRGDKEVVLARLEQLSFFGEMSLICDRPRATTVTCIEAGRLTYFSRDAFEHRLAENDIAAYKVVLAMCRTIAERLTQLEERFIAEHKETF